MNDIAKKVGFNEYNIYPYNAKYIGIYNEDGEKISQIALSKSIFGERLYRVGLVSDTHYNDGVSNTEYVSPEDDGSQYETDLINAMDFFEKKEDVEFVCAAGDITTDRINHVRNFKKNIEKYCPSTPIYTCKGNHDNAAAYNYSSIWKDCISNYDDGKEKIYCDKGDGTSFYFIKTLNSGKKDVYIFLNVDYNNINSSASKFGDSRDDMVEDEDRPHQYYHPEVLDWFANILEQFKHDRCFVFTHLFFRQKAGNYNGYDEYYKYYGSGRSRMYCLRGHDFIKLNDLNNKYKNSIWFTGHSHYSWLWQSRDKNINICAHDSNFIEGNDSNGVPTAEIKITGYKCDSAFNVHLPSLARPLALGEISHQNYYDILDMNGSEGAIMDIYDDYVDIRGIMFKQSESDEYINKYLPIATYRIPIGGKNIKQID